MSEAVAPLNFEERTLESAWFAKPPRVENPELPAWYHALRESAWENFQKLPQPVRTDEHWRFANLRKLNFGEMEPAPALPAGEEQQILEQSQGLSEVSERFVFANNRLITREPAESALAAQGVICQPLERALVEHGDLVQRYFMKEAPRAGGEKFAALHQSADLSGIFLYLPKGARIEKPIEVFHWAKGEHATVFPHTLIVAEEDASAQVVEYYQSAGDDATFAISMADLLSEKGSQVKHLICQQWNSDSRHVHISSTKVGRDAFAQSGIVNLGGEWVRNECVSRMIAPGARSEMLSVGLAGGKEEYDQRTLQLHEAQHTSSDLLYKNALYDTARTIFAGLIVVEPGAHHTDAYQKCRNLMGSGEAEANSMPGLEIDADQVKCSHGSTTGQIDDEELFYFNSRGISEETAREMITFGFLNEVLERFGNEELDKLLLEKVEEEFRRMRAATA